MDKRKIARELLAKFEEDLRENERSEVTIPNILSIQRMKFESTKLCKINLHKNKKIKNLCKVNLQKY